MKIFEITLLFLGSVIGAGFATGAEIVTFFGNLNLPVWVIACLVGLTILAIISLEILIYYPQKQEPLTINNQQNTLKSNWLKKVSNLGIMLVYFILFTTMTAGVSAITNKAFTIISLILSVVIVLFGFEKLSRLNTFLVLIIIMLITTTALPHLSFTKTLVDYNWFHLPKGIISAFLYAGLNCFMFPELIKAAANQHSKKTLFGAATTTAVILTLLVGLVFTTIKNSQTATESIPLLAAAPNIITIIIILLAILTSQYTALFAIMQRCRKLPNFNTKKNRLLYGIVGICTLAFLISLCGFNKIINFAYPLIGAFTCFFLIFSWTRHWLRP